MKKSEIETEALKRYPDVQREKECNIFIEGANFVLEARNKICVKKGHNMHEVFTIHRPNVNGKEIHLGRNKCSRCEYEEDWQYDI